ncbi:hypothetical protein DFAR_200032 [Desulfarculales bacterium]
MPGSFLLPGQAVPPWGERGPKKVHTILRQTAQAFFLFRALFFKTMERFRAQGSLGREKGTFKFKNKLLGLGASTITLYLSLFLWA